MLTAPRGRTTRGPQLPRRPRVLAWNGTGGYARRRGPHGDHASSRPAPGRAGHGRLALRWPGAGRHRAPGAGATPPRLRPGRGRGRLPRDHVPCAARAAPLRRARGAGAGGRAGGARVRPAAAGPWSRGGAGRPRRPRARHGERRAPSDPVWAGGCDESRYGCRAAAALRAHFVAAPAPTPGRPSRGRPPAPARPRRAGRRRSSRARPGEPTAFRRARTPRYGVVSRPLRAPHGDGQRLPPGGVGAMVLGIAKYHRDTTAGTTSATTSSSTVRAGLRGPRGRHRPAVVGAQAQGYNSMSTGVAASVLRRRSDSDPASGDRWPTARLEALAPRHPVQRQVTVTSGGGAAEPLRQGAPSPCSGSPAIATATRRSVPAAACTRACPRCARARRCSRGPWSRAGRR